MPFVNNTYNPLDWYWFVGGNTSQVYSSARAEYVPVSDTTYVAWAVNNTATSILNAPELYEVLILNGFRACSQPVSISPARARRRSMTPTRSIRRASNTSPRSPPASQPARDCRAVARPSCTWSQLHGGELPGVCPGGRGLCLQSGAGPGRHCHQRRRLNAIVKHHHRLMRMGNTNWYCP